MNSFQIYMTFWGIACLIAGVILLKNSNIENIKKYAKFLSKPWRIVTFVISAGGFTLAAPYTGDYTWDYFDGAVMSILTFTSAPLVVGVVLENSKANHHGRMCMWLFA